MECNEDDAKDSRDEDEVSKDKDEDDEEDDNNDEDERDKEEPNDDESEDDEEEEDDEDEDRVKEEVSDVNERARVEEQRSEKAGDDGSPENNLNNSMELFSQTLSSLPLPNKVVATPTRAAPPRRSRYLSFMNDVPGNAEPLNPGSPQQLLGKTPTIEETGTYSLDWSSEREPHVQYQPDFIPVEAADVLRSMLSESLHFEYQFNESMHHGSICKSITRQPRLSAHYGPEYHSSGCTYREKPMTNELLILAQGLNTLLKTKGLRANLNSCLLYLLNSEKDYADFQNFKGGSLNPDSPIVMIGLGHTRHALFREINDPYADALANFSLSNGSLLIMQPHLQKKFLHSLPKPEQPCGQWMCLIFGEIVVPLPTSNESPPKRDQNPVPEEAFLEPNLVRSYVNGLRKDKLAWALSLHDESPLGSAESLKQQLHALIKERLRPDAQLRLKPELIINMVRKLDVSATRAEMLRLHIGPTEKSLEKAALANFLIGTTRNASNLYSSNSSSRATPMSISSASSEPSLPTIPNKPPDNLSAPKAQVSVEPVTSNLCPSTTADKPPEGPVASKSQDPVEPEKKSQKKPKKPRVMTTKANKKTTEKSTSVAPKKGTKEAPERSSKDPPPKQQSCDNDGLMRAIKILEATILTLQCKVDQMEATIALTLQPHKTIMDSKPAKSPKQITQDTQTPAVIRMDQETQVPVKDPSKALNGPAPSATIICLDQETQVPVNDPSKAPSDPAPPATIFRLDQETQVAVKDPWPSKAPIDPAPPATIFSFPDPEQPLSSLPNTSSTPQDSTPSLQSPPNLNLIRTGLLGLAAQPVGQAPPPIAPAQPATRPAWGTRPIREGWTDPASEPPQQVFPSNQPRHAPANSSRHEGGARSLPRPRDRRDKKILIIRDSMLRDFNAGKFFASGMKAEDLNLGSIEEALRETRRIRQSSGVDAYIIELGVNDLKVRTSHRVLTYLNDLISEIRSWAPHATILVSPPVTTKDKSDELSSKIKDFRRLQEKLIEGLKVFDKNIALIFNAGFIATPEASGHYNCLFARDDPSGIHLSDYGTSRLCAYIKRSLFAVWNIPFNTKKLTE